MYNSRTYLMRVWLAALVPWMVTTAAWATEPVAVEVDYTHLGTFKDESVRIDDECWVTPDLLASWGYATLQSGGRLSVVFSGKSFDLPLFRTNEKLYVSMTEASRYLGAVVSWNERRTVYTVRSQIRNLEKTEDGLRIDGTLPVKPRFFRLGNPHRFIIDLFGTRLPANGLGELPEGWRVGQFETDIVRIVIATDEMKDQYVPTWTAARTFMVKFTSEPFEQKIITTDELDEGSIGGFIDPPGQDPDAVIVEIPKPTSTLSMPNLAREDDDGASFMLPYTGSFESGPSAKYINPMTVEIALSKSQLSRAGATQFYDSAYVVSAQSLDDGKGNISIVFTLSEPYAFEMRHNGSLVTMRFFKPSEASGELAQKVIVVDAGHGGRATGTIWKDLQEKEVTLKIARLLADELTAAGASVIMTRNADRDVSLLSRPQIANQSDADMFISVHINSNRTAGSRSGGMTFFHMQDPISMMFAQCIQTEIAAVSKIPDMGVWSDSRIYRTKGFAVLRHSQMPAVLLELGFINHEYDRARVQEDEFQSSVAKAVVQGIKVFLGDVKE